MSERDEGVDTKLESKHEVKREDDAKSLVNGSEKKKPNSAPEKEKASAVQEASVNGVEKSPGASVNGVEKSPGASVNGVEKSLGASVNSVEKSPDASVNGVEKSPDASVNGVEKSPGASVNGVEKSPGASVNGVEKSPGALVNGVEKSPGALVNGVAESPAKKAVTEHDEGFKEQNGDTVSEEEDEASEGSRCFDAEHGGWVQHDLGVEVNGPHVRWVKTSVCQLHCVRGKVSSVL
ncbi:uncharacterized protein LOC143003730 [Genypterus blacodes]|uniref:uncharacterized protein LOC143003730 n=1 Tax=Genypterus blacodes TaxID=154954 RepID=UPI003F76584D